MKNRIIPISATICAALTFAVSGAKAATDTWTGSADDGLWNTTGNWQADTLPVAGDTIVISAAASSTSSTITGGTFSFSSASTLNFEAGTSVSLIGTSSTSSHGLYLSSLTVSDANAYTVNIDPNGGNSGLVISQNGTISVASGGMLTIQTSLETPSGDSSGAIQLTGGGTLVLSTNSTTNYQSMNVTAGTLILSSSGGNAVQGISGIAAGATVQIGSSTIDQTIIHSTNYTNNGFTGVAGTFDLNGYNQTISSLAGTAATGNVTNNAVTSSTLTIGIKGIEARAENSGAFAGTITDGTNGGTMALVLNTYSTTMTETLTGANNYSGGTTISSGTLATGNSSALGTGAVAVNGGALQVSGLLNTGALTINGGLLDLNTHSGSISLASGANFTLTLGTVNLNNNLDQIILSGGGSYALTSSTINLAGFTQGPGTYQIIDGNGTVGSLTFTNGQAGYTYSFDTSGDLIVVPEPSTVALTLIFGAGMLLLFRRRFGNGGNH